MKNFADAVYKKKFKKNVLIQGIFYLILIAMLLGSAIYVNKVYEKQSMDMIYQAAKRTAIECYSIEGSYPADIAYLEENYGLYYDHDKYFVFYDTFGSNIMPTIEVYEKR